MNHPTPAAQDAVASLNIRDLLASMKRVAAGERILTVLALVHLGEILRRKSYRDAGYPTMFAYCVGELHYSEPTAYRRVQAATAANKFPEVLAMLKDGGLTVCSLSIIAPHLSGENSAKLLNRIEGKSARAVLRLAAELKPRPDTRDSIRTLPAPETRSNTPTVLGTRETTPPAPPDGPPPQDLDEPRADTTPPATDPPPTDNLPLIRARPVFSPQVILPRSPGRVQFGFTGSEELLAVIERCRELLWHTHPSGRIEDVLLAVGKAYLAAKDPELLPASAPKIPRNQGKRYIPRWVRSAVYRRDGGRCVFTSEEGRRCGARAGLEYDHIQPWSKGGRSDDPSNIRLLCRAHNRWAAERAGLG